MDNSTLIIVLLIALVVLLAGALFLQRHRSKQLQSHFGPEYERTLKEAGSRQKAEAELHEREKRVRKLSIRPLEPADRERFVGAWQKVQAEFVDDPNGAIVDADLLLQDVMAARGYPVENFDQVAADISVDHPRVVQNFRAGHDIAVRHRRGEADTEDLRQAMIHYRDLFEELVTEGTAPKTTTQSRRETHDAK